MNMGCCFEWMNLLMACAARSYTLRDLPPKLVLYKQNHDNPFIHFSQSLFSFNFPFLFFFPLFFFLFHLIFFNFSLPYFLIFFNLSSFSYFLFSTFFYLFHLCILFPRPRGKGGPLKLAPVSHGHVRVHVHFPFLHFSHIPIHLIPINKSSIRIYSPVWVCWVESSSCVRVGLFWRALSHRLLHTQRGVWGNSFTLVSCWFSTTLGWGETLRGVKGWVWETKGEGRVAFFVYSFASMWTMKRKHKTEGQQTQRCVMRQGLPWLLFGCHWVGWVDFFARQSPFCWLVWPLLLACLFDWVGWGTLLMGEVNPRESVGFSSANLRFTYFFEKPWKAPTTF